MLDKRDAELRVDGWTDLEIGLLNAYETSAGDYAALLLKANVVSQKLARLRDHPFCDADRHVVEDILNG